MSGISIKFFLYQQKTNTKKNAIRSKKKNNNNKIADKQHICNILQGI